MTRISTNAANALLVQQIFRTQQRVVEGEVQITSEKRSIDYQGIAINSQRLVNIENTRDALQRYITNNEQMDVRLEVRESVLEGVYDTIKDFRSQLRTYGTFEPKDSERVQDIQNSALRSLKSLQDLLNTDVDGRHLFAGTRSTTQPVDFGLTSLSAFQTTYDGARSTVPTTRDAHLADFSIATDTNNENKQYITNANFLQFRQEELYDINFTSGTKTIAAQTKADGSAATSVFSSLSAGDSITLTGSTSNNSTFTVATVSSDGSSITVNEAVAAEFDTDGVTFSGALALTPGTGTSIIEASSAMFSNVTAGTDIVITDSTSNNGTYKVSSVSSDGRTITINTEMLRDESSVTSPTITYPDPVDPTKTLTLDSTTLGTLSFTRSNDTVTATGSLSALTVGTAFTVSGSTHNNGTYTVKTNDGTNLVIESVKLTDEGTAVTNSATDSTHTVFDLFTRTDVVYDTGGTITVVRSGASTGVEGVFSSLAVGSTVATTNSNTGGNDQTYTVSAISADGSQITVTPVPGTSETDSTGVTFAGTGGTTFDFVSLKQLEFTNVGAAGTDTIHIEDSAGATLTTGYFSDLNPGQQFTVSGSANGVDGTYTVASVSANGSTITIEENLTATVVENTQEVRVKASAVETFFDMRTFTDVRFDTTDKSIEVRRAGSNVAVRDIFEGLAVGNQITITNSTSNNGTFTIATISSDKSKITVSEALTTTEQDAAGVTMAGAGDVSFNYESKSELVFTDVGAAGTDTIHIRDLANNTITTGVFSNLKAGQKFTIWGSAGGVDKEYTVKSISSDGSTITVDEEISATVTEDSQELRMQVFASSATVAATNYYAGDERSTTHRVNKNRSFTQDFNAIDPAIEKAVRAMKLIMQGQYGTEGGLDQNDTRVNQALFLLDSSLERTVGGTPPFGTEQDGNLTEARSNNAFNRILISNLNEQNTTLIGYFDSSIADIENIDPTEAITKLLDDQRALEASYQIFSRIRQLSLTNYI